MDLCFREYTYWASFTVTFTSTTSCGCSRDIAFVVPIFNEHSGWWSLNDRRLCRAQKNASIGFTRIQVCFGRILNEASVFWMSLVTALLHTESEQSTSKSTIRITLQFWPVTETHARTYSRHILRLYARDELRAVPDVRSLPLFANLLLSCVPW